MISGPPPVSQPAYVRKALRWLALLAGTVATGLGAGRAGGLLPDDTWHDDERHRHRRAHLRALVHSAAEAVPAQADRADSGLRGRPATAWHETDASGGPQQYRTVRLASAAPRRSHRWRRRWRWRWSRSRIDASTTSLVQYLEQHQGSATYLVAVNGSQSAGPFILESGKAVIAMGGFGGSDPAPTLSEFKQLVASRQGALRLRLRWVRFGGRCRRGRIRRRRVVARSPDNSQHHRPRERAGTRSTRPTGQGVQASSASAVDAWVEKHGTKVSASAYGGTSTGGTLYYIGSAAASQ